MTEENKIEQPVPVEPKSGLQFEVRKYLGKELKKEGVRVDKETKEEIKWKLFTLLTENLPSTYPKKFSCFNSISDKGIQPKDLEEGEFYKLGYIEESYTNSYGPQISKSVRIIQLSTEKEFNEQEQAASIAEGNNNNSETPSPVNSKPSADDWLQRNKQMKRDVQFGQAINLAMQIYTSDKNFEMKDFDATVVKDLTFEITLPLLQKMKKEEENRREVMKEYIEKEDVKEEEIPEEDVQIQEASN